MSDAPRLILVDLDGTLVGLDGVVSPRNSSVLKRAVTAGCRVVVATGRPARIVTPLRKSLGHAIALCYNGAIVLDLATGNILEAHLLDGPVFQDAVERVRASGYTFVVAVEGMPDIGIRAETGFREGFPIPRGTLAELCSVGIVKGLVRVDADQFEAVWDAFSDGFRDTLEVTRSGVEGLIEVSAAGVSKGGVIAGLAASWGIDAADAIAFGDMPNDLEMFRWAGRSVAMGNAEPEVKLAATEVGAHHDEDAVAQVLERWF
ncbi:MAG: Cof-like hydrolase [Glaciihabitans sp.]|nr:Cof-like hydrolase [Glaciihabitans sp.]